jgi:hypothetical protein
VVQTQTAKLATVPGLTREVAENDCTWTHNCGVFGFGGGELVVGLGLGVGDGEVPVGDGDGLGLEDGFVSLLLGDGSLLLGAGLGLELGDCGGLVVGSEVGLALAVVLSVGVALALDVELALALDVELALARVLLGRALLACALDVARVLAGAKCASSVALLGTTAHAALTIGPTGCTGPPSTAARA